jgi:hypothetical protein
MMFGITNSHDCDVSDIHGYVPGYPAEDDIWMVRLNASGDILWQRCIGTYGAQRIQKNSILKLGEADYVIACTTDYGGYDDILCTYEYTGVTRYFTWLFQITDTAASLGITEQLPTINIKLYPNPATDYIALEIPPEFDMKQAIAEITDIAGRKMQSIVLSGNKPYLYTGDLPAGLYLLRLINKQGFVSKRFVKN